MYSKNLRILTFTHNMESLECNDEKSYLFEKI